MSEYSETSMKDELYSILIASKSSGVVDKLIDEFVSTWSPKYDGPIGKCGSCKYSRIIERTINPDAVTFICSNNKIPFYEDTVRASVDGCVHWKKR